MRTIALSAAITAFAALGSGLPVCAQTQIPLPPFVRTYTAGATRGYFFQAPIDFKIVGLQVPDETNHGLQNVAVYLMSAAPPAFSGSASGGLAFFSAGQPSSQIIATNITVPIGQWVGVLGACGDASTMRNSYGAPGPFASNVLGVPVTLTRFLTQTNIVTTQGNAPYSSEAAFEVSRVEMYVAPACAGSIRATGQGCTDSGNVVNTLSFVGCPDRGTQLTIDFANGAAGPCFLIFGLSNTNWLGIALPLDLQIFGGPGCSLYVSHELVLGPFASTGATFSVPFQVPLGAHLVGQTTHVQGFHIDGPANPLHLVTTNYLTLVVG